MDAPWAAVVVNYEAGDALTVCVQSLLADDSAGAAPDVVVVDNGSRDGSVDALRRVVPGVRVLDAGGNVGYATAANRGTAATAAAVVAVCNPDLEVRPGTGAAMLAAFADPRVGAAGPRVRNPDGSTYPSARRDPAFTDAVGHALLGFVWPRNPFTRRYRELDADPAVARDVDWASGAALWLRRAAIDGIGGWDEGYFMYMEDVDVGWRLRSAGWRVRYEPAGEVVHRQGLSTDRRPNRMIVEHHRSLLRLATKRWHGPKRLLLVPAAAFLTIRAGFTMAVRALSPRGSRPRVTR
ncbi:MAG: glycosyltransferase family 2 protein [Acidimicrobiia bacterium]